MEQTSDMNTYKLNNLQKDTNHIENFIYFTYFVTNGFVQSIGENYFVILYH